jgi:spore coat protein U-like protein
LSLASTQKKIDIPTYNIMKKFLALTVLVAAASVAAVAPAMAQQDQTTPAGNFDVQAQVNKSCTTPLANNVNVGAYDGNSDATGNTVVVYKCTNGTPSTLNLTSRNNKLLKDGAKPGIPYDFTSTTIRSVGTGLAIGPANLGAQVDIKVPAGQNPPPGNYSDTMDATVSY